MQASDTYSLPFVIGCERQRSSILASQRERDYRRLSRF